MKLKQPAFLVLFLSLLGNAGFLLGQNKVPVIENPNPDPVQYCSDPVAVASAISIQNIQVDEKAEGMKISIAGYRQGEDVLVFDRVGSFQYNWNVGAGTLEISGIGSDKEYEEAVSKVYYQNNASSRTIGIRSFSISLRDADYLPATGHFYRFIAQESITWRSARSRADSMDYNGLQGYLATIRSKEEQDFIYTKTEGTGWIGGSDEEKEGTWKWVDGPAEDHVVFWSGASNGSLFGGEYSHWGSGEPNNSGDEDYAHILYSAGVRGYWNDLPNGGSNYPGYIPQGFLIEYGGMPGDPVVKLSAVAFVEVKESKKPELDMNRVKTLFCGGMTHELTLDFSNGSPLTKLTPFDSRVVVTNEETYNPTVVVLEYGKYSFQLDMVDASGCEYKDTLEIGIHNQPEASFNLDSSTCYAYNLQLVFTDDTVEETEFTWYYNQEEFQSGIGLDSVVMPLGFEDDDRTVGLKVNEQGCTDSMTMPVKVKPDIFVADTNSSGCSPLEVSFAAKSTNKPAHSYSWDFADGTSSTEQNLTHIFTNTGDSTGFFDIRLTVLSDDGCENTAIFENMVNVYPVPGAQFTADPQDALITNPEINFINTSHAGASYFWDFGDSAYSKEMSPGHRYDEMGIYRIMLQVSNDFGCSDSMFQEVTVTFDQLFAPNAFSPNASLDEDRVFRLYGDGVLEKGYKLLVFNRWGQLIFESNSPTTGWDGKMENSEFAPTGVYAWVLQYTDFTGEKHVQQGSVSLLF